MTWHVHSVHAVQSGCRPDGTTGRITPESVDGERSGRRGPPGLDGVDRRLVALTANNYRG